MKKRVAKIVVYIAGTVILAATVFMFAFDSGLPKTPDATTGRIYPLTYKGSVRRYMTHKEKLEYELSLGLCALFIII